MSVCIRNIQAQNFVSPEKLEFTLLMSRGQVGQVGGDLEKEQVPVRRLFVSLFADEAHKFELIEFQINSGLFAGLPEGGGKGRFSLGYVDFPARR